MGRGGCCLAAASPGLCVCKGPFTGRFSAPQRGGACCAGGTWAEVRQWAFTGRSTACTSYRCRRDRDHSGPFPAGQARRGPCGDFTCAAGMNPALRQEFAAQTACTPQKGGACCAGGTWAEVRQWAFTGRSTACTSCRCRRDRDHSGPLSGPGGAASSRCRRPGLR